MSMQVDRWQVGRIAASSLDNSRRVRLPPIWTEDLTLRLEVDDSKQAMWLMVHGRRLCLPQSSMHRHPLFQKLSNSPITAMVCWR